MMIREQWVLPHFHSKAVTRVSLLAIYNGDVFSFKTTNMVQRNCARPPSKTILIQKVESYLGAKGLKSGYDHAKKAYPDKNYLVLAVACLSKGRDEIFEVDYMPPKGIEQQLQQKMSQMDQKVLFQKIPAHLQSKMGGRSLQLHQLTKAEKLEQ